jgi:hypothetical protein
LLDFHEGPFGLHIGSGLPITPQDFPNNYSSDFSQSLTNELLNLAPANGAPLTAAN